MKKVFAVLVCLAIGLFAASAAMAYTAGTGIVGSPHDLSASGPMGAQSPDTLNRVCIFCHAPHNTYRLDASISGSATATGGTGPIAPAAYDYLPLWNHLLPIPPTYSMYYNGPGAPDPTISAKGSQAILLNSGRTAPGGASLLCLSCHDGITAINTYGNSDQPGSSTNVGSTTMPLGYKIGVDGNLQNHHPIAFAFTAAMGGLDPGITDPAQALYNGTTDFVVNHLYSYTVGGTSYTSQMECGTCHSVHNTANSGERLLWRSDANSNLCLTCHIKGPKPTPGTVNGEVSTRTDGV